MTQMSSVIQASDLDPATNHYLDVVNRGFNIGDSGLYFPCGVSSIKLEKGNTETLLLVSKVAIKKTETLSVNNLSENSIVQIAKTRRFDSIFVDERGGEDQHPFKANYVLLNQNQILPTHLVFVKYHDLNFGVNLVHQLCEVCAINPAKVHCENDSLDMCYNCDNEYHPSSNKVANKHRRVDLSEKEIELDFCRFHPKVRQETCCMNCKKCLCITCQLSGFHSEPQYKDHKLVSVHECYEFLKETRKVKTPLMVKIKAKINQYYNSVDNVEEDQAPD